MNSSRWSRIVHKLNVNGERRPSTGEHPQQSHPLPIFKAPSLAQHMHVSTPYGIELSSCLSMPLSLYKSHLATAKLSCSGSKLTDMWIWWISRQDVGVLFGRNCELLPDHPKPWTGISNVICCRPGILLGTDVQHLR